MGEVKKVLFIVNKFAGGGYSPDVEGRIIRTCEQYDAEGVIHFTSGPGHATVLAREAVQLNAQRVVAVGGDGTINEVARGLVDSPMPMAIIPRGSGNGLARHLCIPLSVQGALHSFFRGRVIEMDTFRMNDKLSLNVSGIGFDGRVANLFGGKTKRGLSGYINLVLREFTSFPQFRATLSAGTFEFEREAFVVAIANSSQYGNNACIAPSASVCDGLLHLNILKKVPAYRFDFVYAFFTKSIDRSSFAEIIEVDKVSIRTTRPVPYHVDGEPCGEDVRFDIAIAPASLRIVVPAAKNFL